MRRIIVAVALALCAALIPGPASAETFRSDSAAYNGSYSALGFSVFEGGRLRSIRATVDLPARYRNSFCAYARIGVNGVFVAQSYRDCDTNGDATLTFRLPNIRASKGDYIEVWFSDPVTRFHVTHPTIIL
jgi:hypothetical protein